MVTEQPHRFVHLVEITRDCDLHCPVCYAEAGPGAGGQLALSEILARGRMILADGGHTITLTGGEPTTHPHLIAAVAGLRRLGLRVDLVSNGVRLGNDPALARTLARAGAHKVLLQCDSLDPEHRWLLRGDTDTTVPQRAAQAVLAAGLRLGLVVTVCDRNLPAIGTVLDWALGLTPGLHSVQFQGFAPSGRFPSGLGTVSSDDILAALALGTRRADLAVADFHASPVHAPWRAATHPDCARVVVLLRRGASWIPLGREADVPSLLARWAARPAGSGLWKMGVRPLSDLWRSTHSGSRLRVLRDAVALASGHGGGAACLLMVGTLPQDPGPERLARCSTCFMTADGPVAVCQRQGFH